MKIVLMLFACLLSQGAISTVVELDDGHAKKVIAVYEEMREEQVDAPENAWIHEFERDSLGAEMDHLSRLKVKHRAREEM